MICSRPAAGSGNAFDPGAVLAREQIGALGHPVVVEHRLHPLLPLAAIVDQRVTQPNPGAQIEDVIRADPRVRQPPGQQQLAHVPSIGPVVLRALLVAAQRAGLRRLSQMWPGARPPQLLDHEPPAGRRLQCRLELHAIEPLKEPTGRLAVRRRHPCPRNLTALGIDSLRCDLRPVLVQSHHDRHLSSLLASNLTRAASSPTHHYRGSRSALRVRTSGRAGASRACLRRTPFDAEGRRPSRAPPHRAAHAIFGFSASQRSSGQPHGAAFRGAPARPLPRRAAPVGA